MSNSNSTADPDPSQQDVIDCQAPNILVTAPPGRGKTLVAIWKAHRIIDSGVLRPWQKVLFLSFSRSAVAQVARGARQHLSLEHRARIEMATYHSFFFRVVKAYGRYAGLPRSLDILSGPQRLRLCRQLLRETGVDCSGRSRRAVEDWAAALTPSGHAPPAIEEGVSGVAGLGAIASQVAEAKGSWPKETGRIHFDDFAHYAHDLLSSSERLRQAFRMAYPVVIADEFQDTNAEQWAILQLLSEGNSLIAFADLHQLIFASFGASHHRLDDLSSTRSPTELALTHNYRMHPDIERFAQAVASLAAAHSDSGALANRTSSVLIKDEPTPSLQAYAIKWPIMQARAKSVAVLAPRNEDVKTISACLFRETKKTRVLYHQKITEQDCSPAAADAALALAEVHLTRSLAALHRFGSALSCICGNPDADCADLLLQCNPGEVEVRPGRPKPFSGACRVLAPRLWSLVSSYLETKHSDLDALLQNAFITLEQMAKQDKKLGSDLSSRLADERDDLTRSLCTFLSQGAGSLDLEGFRKVIAKSRLQAALMDTGPPPQRVQVMTMHKAKGREFDHVYVLNLSEGVFPHPSALSDPERFKDAVNLLYVAATRAKEHLELWYTTGKPSQLLQPFL